MCAAPHPSNIPCPFTLGRKEGGGSPPTQLAAMSPMLWASLAAPAAAAGAAETPPTAAYVAAPAQPTVSADVKVVAHTSAAQEGMHDAELSPSSSWDEGIQ